MLQKRDGRTRIYRLRNERFVGTASLRSTISAEEVWWCGHHRTLASRYRRLSTAPKKGRLASTRRFYGDGFWLSVPIFVGDLWHLMLFLLLSDKRNWCTSTTTLPPLDTEMRFWHHTCCPQWAFVGKFFSTTTLGCTQFVLLLTF
jgi:hypothetical protein